MTPRKHRRTWVATATAAVAVAAVGAGVGRAAAGPTNTAPPAIVGQVLSGATLTAQPGTWTGAGTLTYAYQWQRCSSLGGSCSDIDGATASTYALTSADVDRTVRVQVSANDDTGRSTVPSRATAVIRSGAPVTATPPRIAGTLRIGQVLTATTGTWTGTTPTAYAYAWQRCDANGATCTAIAGATKSTYTLVVADAGKTLRVAVQATNPGGAASATSVPTGVVAGGVPASFRLLAGGVRSVAAEDVDGEHRLVIERVGFSPFPLRSRTPVEARVVVTDTRGYRVRNARVFVTGLPYGRLLGAEEARTRDDGTATFTLQPTRRLPIVRGASLVLFVRARVEGDRLIAGASTRRLVQLRIVPA